MIGPRILGTLVETKLLIKFLSTITLKDYLISYEFFVPREWEPPATTPRLATSFFPLISSVRGFWVVQLSYDSSEHNLAGMCRLL